MTAYTLNNAVNTWGTTTDFTPNGTPVAGVDTLTIGANQELRFPSNATLCASTIGGSSGSAYAKLTIQTGATLTLGAAQTVTDWVEIEFQGTSSLDLNGNDFAPVLVDASGVRFKVTRTGGAGKATVLSTAAKANFGGTSGAIGAYVDLDGFKLDNIHWRMGGSYYGGHHFRMRNGVVINYGAFSTSSYQQDDADWILENVELRDCNEIQSVDIGDVVADIGCHPVGDADGADVTGERIFKNVVFDATNTVGLNKKVKLYWFRGFTPENTAYIECAPYGQQSTAVWDKVISLIKSEANAEFGTIEATNLTVFSYGDNPKHFNGNGTWTEPIVECLWLSGVSADAGDLWVIGNTGDLVLDHPIIIDAFGSGIVNALSAPRGCNVTIDHATYIADPLHPLNGAIRNEGGGSYTGTVNAPTNSIFYIRSNPTSAPIIYGVNFTENTADDQITTFDYNSWVNYPSTLDSSIYHELNSATKSIGDANYGQNDDFNDPEFVNDDVGILQWGAARGESTLADSIQLLIRGINGYDSATESLNPAYVVDEPILAYRQYIKDGLAPTNPVYETNDSTGGTRGAVGYVPAGVGEERNSTMRVLHVSGAMLSRR